MQFCGAAVCSAVGHGDILQSRHGKPVVYDGSTRQILTAAETLEFRVQPVVVLVSGAEIER